MAGKLTNTSSTYHGAGTNSAKFFLASPSTYAFWATQGPQPRTLRPALHPDRCPTWNSLNRVNASSKLSKLTERDTWLHRVNPIRKKVGMLRSIEEDFLRAQAPQPHVFSSHVDTRFKIACGVRYKCTNYPNWRCGILIVWWNIFPFRELCFWREERV